ncbi:MAG: dephospho-CoA kinase [Candidatus Nanopelagicales bacterium]
MGEVAGQGMLVRVVRVGLTGGIGSGKSTVAAMLAERGAVVIDADRIARDVVAPGEPALAEIAARFGAGVIRADGSLDRAGLAAIVFPDPDALAALEAIMHPRIDRRAGELLDDALASGARVVVYDMPLLVENGQSRDFDLVVVVHAPAEARVARLVHRGLAEADARARMVRQASDAERLAVADVVIDNSGSPADLAGEVKRAWQVITAAA